MKDVLEGGRRFEADDLWNSLPTQTILEIYDSVLQVLSFILLSTSMSVFGISRKGF